MVKIKKWKIGHIFTHEENRQKNKDIYPEGMTKESSEESYLVFDNNNKGNLCETLLELGEYYNQDSIYFKPQNSLSGYLIGTNGADFPGYHQKGDESKFMISTASNYMSRLKNSAFSFVTDAAIKNVGKKESMDAIAKETKEQGYPNQHYWQDNDKTSFHKRKELCSVKKESVIYNLINICENKGIVNLETLHPLTQKSLCEHYKKSLINETVDKVLTKFFKK